MYGGLKINTSTLPESLDFNELSYSRYTASQPIYNMLIQSNVYTKSIAIVSVIVTAFFSIVRCVH